MSCLFWVQASSLHCKKFPINCLYKYHSNHDTFTENAHIWVSLSQEWWRIERKLGALLSLMQNMVAHLKFEGTTKNVIHVCPSNGIAHVYCHCLTALSASRLRWHAGMLGFSARTCGILLCKTTTTMQPPRWMLLRHISRTFYSQFSWRILRHYAAVKAT